MSNSDSEEDFLNSLQARGPNDDHPFGSPSRQGSPSGGISPPPDLEEDSQLCVPPPLDAHPAVDPSLTGTTATTHSDSQELVEFAQCIKRYKSLSECSESDLDKYAVVHHCDKLLLY